jgi:hypothetical protein
MPAAWRKNYLSKPACTKLKKTWTRTPPERMLQRHVAQAVNSADDLMATQQRQVKTIGISDCFAGMVSP